MSLQTAIQALNPRNYWTLSETSGTFFTDLGSTPNAMQVTGDPAGMGATGPEVGSHALRVFSAWTSATSGMGITAWGDLTVSVLATCPSNGTISTLAPFAGLGDINNPTTRGFWINQFSSTVNSLTLGLSTTAGAANQAAVQPFTFWHMFAFTFTATGTLRKTYVDGVLTNQTTQALGTAPLTGDTFWIKSAQPIVVAHLAYWPRVLSQAEVQSVSNQIQVWPYGEPINVSQTGVSGPVTISPTDTVTQQILSNQSTFMPQVTDIATKQTTILANTNTMDTNWSNYTSVTLPSLNTMLSNILDGVTSTITGLTGSVQKTIGQLFSGFDPNNITSISLGSACAGSVITANLGINFYYGVTMQCTSYAAWYVFTGPADDYTTQALGTLDITRGGNLVLRKGLHTLTDEVYPLPALPPIEQVISVGFTPGDYVVTLTPAPETCWTMQALRFTP